MYRNACLEGVQQHCPKILAWSCWCLSGPSKDVLGYDVPLLFSFGLCGALATVAETTRADKQWYLDEGPGTLSICTETSFSILN